MRPRGCLFGCGSVVFIVLLVCGLLYFIGLPRFQDRIRNELADSLATEVSRQINAQVSGAKLRPGEYRLSFGALQQEMNEHNENDEISGFRIRSDGDEIVLGIQMSGQTLEYRGVPEIIAGRLHMTDMTSTSGALDFFLPPDKLGQAVDTAINSYIQNQGMNLRDVSVTGNDLVFDVEE